jgi:hypothetical protein
MIKTHHYQALRKKVLTFIKLLKSQNGELRYNLVCYDTGKRVPVDVWYEEGKKRPEGRVLSIDTRDARTYGNESTIGRIVRQYDTQGRDQAPWTPTQD